MRHFLVPQGGHGLLDIGLRGDQFTANGCPITLPTEIGKARTMTHYPVAHTKTPSLTEQNTAEVIHQISFLAFDNEETVSYQATKDQAHLIAAGRHSLWEFALKLFEG